MIKQHAADRTVEKFVQSFKDIPIAFKTKSSSGSGKCTVQAKENTSKARDEDTKSYAGERVSQRELCDRVSQRELCFVTLCTARLQ